MKDFIKKRLVEGLDPFADISRETWVSAYTKKINELYDNLIAKGQNNPNFEFILGNEISYNPSGEPNKCETNAFNFVKENLDGFYPVGGFMFVNKSLFPIEHWWVYDIKSKKHIEITPLGDEKPRCYAGIINTSIQKEIQLANKFYDVDFFKGGHVEHTYFK